MTVWVPLDTALITHVMTLTGDPEPMTVTAAVRYTTAWDEATADAAIVDIHTAFGQYVVNTMANVITLVRSELQWPTEAPSLLDPDQTFNVAIRNETFIGSGTSTVCPQNTATLVHKRTSRGGRRGRGRLYLPAVPEEAVSAAGALTSGFITQVNTGMATYLEAVNDIDDVELVLTHSFDPTDPPPDSTGLVPNAITLLQCDPIAATQRRRLRR